MYRIGKYIKTDRMGHLICENYPLLIVISRFGISLGFGDKTVEVVCKEYNVDVETFLSVVNFLVEDEKTKTDVDLSVESLVSYLRNSHSYFLNYRLPAIRENLTQALNWNERDVAQVIIRFYDGYVQEVQKHMEYEENVVFAYVQTLLAGQRSEKYNIEIFGRQHDNIEEKLSELKDIIIKYYPGKNSDKLNSVLFDIFCCAQDLASHNEIENYLFIPAIRKIEDNG